MSMYLSAVNTQRRPLPSSAQAHKRPPLSVSNWVPLKALHRSILILIPAQGPLHPHSPWIHATPSAVLKAKNPEVTLNSSVSCTAHLQPKEIPSMSNISRVGTIVYTPTPSSRTEPHPLPGCSQTLVGLPAPPMPAPRGHCIRYGTGHVVSLLCSESPGASVSLTATPFESPVLSTPSSPDQIFGLQMSAHLLRRSALTSGCKITDPPLWAPLCLPCSTVYSWPLPVSSLPPRVTRAPWNRVLCVNHKYVNPTCQGQGLALEDPISMNGWMNEWMSLMQKSTLLNPLCPWLLTLLHSNSCLSHVLYCR